MCTSIDAYFLCPYDPVPLTQSRQEHVHRARRTRKGLVCIYVGGVCRHVGGFQQKVPAQVHERMTRKCDIWPHLTPLHTAHTHHNASVSQNNTPNSVVLQMAKTSPERLRSHWPHRQHRAHQTKTCQKRCLETFRQCNGASITYVVFEEGYLGDGVVCLVTFRKKSTLAHTWLHACFAERSHSCAAPYARIGLSPSAACEAMARTCMMLAVRKVMFLGVLAQHARSCRVISCWISCLPSKSAPDTQHEIPLRPALFPYIANSSRLLRIKPSSRRNTNLTSTDCDVMTTSNVAPTQNVARV